MTFGELTTLYVERYAKPSKASWRSDVGLLRNARKVWSERPAASIVRQDMARLLFEVAGRAPVVANRLRSVLGKMFAWAVDNALLDENPTLGTKKPTKESRGKTRTLSDAEIRLLWPAFDRLTSLPGAAAAFRIMLLLGSRPGEVAGMATDELHGLDDPKAALWSVPASRMKSRRPHLVPLPLLAASIIRAELARRPGAEFVFASRLRDRERLVRHSLTNALARLIKGLDDAGPEAATVARLKADRPTPHDLRRTTATTLSRLQVPREDRLAVLAHTYGDVHGQVYDRYDRLREKRVALEALERHLSKVIAGEREEGAEVIALRHGPRATP